MADGIGLPGGANGQANVGYTDLHVGLGIGSTAYGSGVLSLDDANGTPVAIVFNATALGQHVPLELRFRALDGTTQVAGYFATSLDGVANVSTVKRRVDASGYTVFDCYELYASGGTLYLLLDADPGADGFLDYLLRCARKHSGGSAV